MKEMKKQPRFWGRLTRKGGFTLVELIVVIAVLAILATVAVPAYSGYVTKANKQADMTLVGEVKHALALGSYSGINAADGYVILHPNADPEYSSDEIEDCLNAAFGSNLDALRLKYDGWNAANSADVIAILQAQGADMAAAVANSSYAQNVGQMLEDAQDCTLALNNFILSNFSNSQTMYDALQEFSDQNGSLNDIMNKAGLLKTDSNGQIQVGDSGNALLKDPDNTSATQMSNALLLAIANEVNMSNAELDNTADAVLDYWSGESDGDEFSLLTKTAIRYAYLESAVCYFQDPALTATFENMNTTFDNATSVSDVTDAMNRVEQMVKGKIMELNDPDKQAEFFNQLSNDAAAFSGVMDAVAQVKDNYADEGLLAQEGLYTSDNISNLVNSYVTAANCFDGLSDKIPVGSILIVHSAGTQNQYSVPNE